MELPPGLLETPSGIKPWFRLWPAFLSNYLEYWGIFLSQQCLAVLSKAPANAHGCACEGLIIWFPPCLALGLFPGHCSTWEPGTCPWICPEGHRGCPGVRPGPTSARVCSLAQPCFAGGSLSSKYPSNPLLQETRMELLEGAMWAGLGLLSCGNLIPIIYQGNNILNTQKCIQLFQHRENIDITENIMQGFI